MPQISAFPIEFSDRDVLEIPGFIAEKHGSLQNQKDILLNLLNKLQIAQAPSGTIEDIRGRRGGRGREEARSIKSTRGISLDVEDLYLQDEAIEIKARVNSDDAKFDVLKAEIECLSEPLETMKLDFAVEGSEFVLRPESLKSQPGLYRLTVHTGGTGENSLNAVHDLFEVANINSNQ